MGRSSFDKKIEEIKELERVGMFTEAAEAADDVQWKKCRDIRTLKKISSIYEKCGRYDDAKEILMLAYNRTEPGKQMLYRLSKLSAMTGDIDGAEEFYWEFKDAAPSDPKKLLLVYYITCAKDEPNYKKIQVLEKYNNINFDEKWASILSQLYYNEGLNERCIEVCDEIILWCSGTVYGDNALKLKHKCLGIPEEDTVVKKRTDAIEINIETPFKKTEAASVDLDELDIEEALVEDIEETAEKAAAGDFAEAMEELAPEEIKKTAQATEEAVAESAEEEIEEIIDEPIKNSAEEVVIAEKKTVEEIEIIEKEAVEEVITDASAEDEKLAETKDDDELTEKADNEDSAEDNAIAEDSETENTDADAQSEEEGKDLKKSKVKVIGYLNKENAFEAISDSTQPANETIEEKIANTEKQYKKNINILKKKNAKKRAGVKIYLIECNQPRGRVKYAANTLMGLHRDEGTKILGVAKITDKKFADKGVEKTLSLLNGRDLVVEGVTNITYEMVREMTSLLDEARKPTVIVLLDTVTRLALFVNRHRSFADKCTYVFEENEITREDFIECVNNYAYRASAVLDDTADDAVEEIADELFNDGLILTAAYAEEITARAIDNALKPGIKGLFEAKKNEQGYLILRSRHFDRG